MNTTLKIVLSLLSFLLLTNCQSALEKEYEIIRQIQKEGNAKEIFEPEQIGMFDPDDKPRHVVSLTLSNIGLESLSPKIAGLEYLEELELSGNELVELPNEISLLTNLKKINLSRNNLEKLPDSFSNLSNLIELNVSENNISQIPQFFETMQSLIRVSIHENNIRELGNITSTQKKWEWFQLGDNYLCEPTKEEELFLIQFYKTDWKSFQKCE
jgi:Leucine-rich repeat (LRR) protein